MYQFVLALHVLIAIFLIIMVLLQHGKGADIGAAFGSGASNTLFGSQGTGGFLFKVTGGLALAFFVTSLSLAFMVSHRYNTAAKQAIPKPLTTSRTTLPMPAEIPNG